MTLRVTFDTNTLDSVVWPETAQRGTGPSGAKIRSAIKTGCIQGFFSETLITIEGIRNKDRAKVFGSSQLAISSSSESKSKITLKLAFQQDRNSLDSKFFERIRTARELGMRVLMVPRLLGIGVCAKDDDGTLFEPIEDLEQFVAKAAHLRSEIGGRSIGHAVAIELGLKFSARAGISQQELWLQGLGRASTKAEKEQVALAAREWADGDSIAAHHGYNIDLFCTEDCGKSASSPSVLDPKNKKWLSKNYGIRFVTLAELAEMVTR